MNPRAELHLAKVAAGLPANPPPPANAIAPLKARLQQLRGEYPSAPPADRPRIATAIAHVEQLIQKLERQNGPRHS